MRRYLILVNNIQQAENIVGLFDDGYTKRKHCNSDYVIIKNDESVVYDILLSGKNYDYYRGRRWNGVIRCCIVSYNELNNNIYPYIIEEYYDDEKNLHLLPSVNLFCNNDEMFLNAIKLIENYNKSNKKGRIMEEDRLGKTISDVAYILDNLMLLRQIQQTGNCNNCKNENCGHIPRAGQMVRYNCPFYEKH